MIELLIGSIGLGLFIIGVLSLNLWLIGIGVAIVTALVLF